MDDCLNKKFSSYTRLFFEKKSREYDNEESGFYRIMLEPPPIITNEEDYLKFKALVENTNFYPMRPFCNTVIDKLVCWINHEEFVSKVRLKHLHETSVGFSDNVLKSIDKLRKCLFEKNKNVGSMSNKDDVHSVDFHGAVSTTHCPDSSNPAPEFFAMVDEVLENLTKADILFLLGMRRTVGSVTVLPPDISNLWLSYQALGHAKSSLTVGARALSKHCHRSGDNWWGVCTGSENNKNEHALAILERIFLDAVWINVHTLPHNVQVLEVRCSEGYGLRWTSNGCSFRGFLEPQMTDGHEKGWRY